MFAGKDLVTHIRDVPATWIFETYLGLPDKLGGQTVRMASPFAPNSSHTDPLALYYNTSSKLYRWKCFSSGKGGTAVDLIMALWQKGFHETAQQIEYDYAGFLKAGNTPAQLVEMQLHKWQLVAFEIRPWDADDARYWPQYHITGALLEEHWVKPLRSFTLQLFINGEPQPEKVYQVAGKHLYAYFDDQRQVYKIYQPLNHENKFKQIGHYLQGRHQLRGHPYLLITSGMKDMLALKSLQLRCDYVAPSSENNILPFETIDELVQEYKYQAVISLLDNDTTGINCMRAYRQRYGIPYVYLRLEKDPADAMKVHGPAQVLERVVPAIHRAAELYTGLHNFQSTLAA